MIIRFLFSLIVISILYPNKLNNSNSIFYNANSPRVSALAGCLFVSNNLSDVFNNPLDLNEKIVNKTYFSFYNYFNAINVFQFTYKIINTDRYNINIGFISRTVESNYNTSYAWLYNDGGPEYEQIDYSNIYSYRDQEIGFLFSYDKVLNKYIINAKIKPIVHLIDNDKSIGVNLDFFISRKFNNLRLMLGLINSNYKDWKDQGYERKYFDHVLSADLKFNNFFTVLNITRSNSKFGLEYYFSDNFILRLGIDNNNKYSYGFGITMDYIDFNYSFYNIDDIYDGIKQFSVAFNFN